MRLLLTHEGYAARTAGRAEEALELLDTFHPELILADVSLPGIDGLELARRIKNDPRTSTIKFVALTASPNSDAQERLRVAGCDGFIVRPADAQTLSHHVRETLDRPVAQRPQTAAPPSSQMFGPGISDEEVEHLRHSFLNEGAERTLHLLETLDEGFDPEQAGKLLHSWAGTGGLLGFPEISKLARANEELLRGGAFRRTDFRESLSALLITFSELRAAVTVPIPGHVSESLRGKRIALIAFSTDRADFLCAALEQVSARPRLYDLADATEAKSIAECELIIVHVRPETLGCVWLDPATIVPEGCTLVLSGDRRDLLSLPPAVQSRQVEFLVDTWHPEEVLMRLHLAASRRGVVVAPPEPVAPQTAASGASHAPASTAQASVVIADDDDLIVTVVSSTLQNYGMSCRHVTNGEDALRIIREHPPSLAVLDVNMPGLDGFEVLAAIRKENLPVCVVLLTARQREDDILRGFQLGADDYLVKPFNPLELVARLKRLLKQ